MLKRIGWRRIALFVLVLLLVTHVALVASGNTYLYAAVRYKWPDILDHEHFDNRTIDRGEPQPWPKHPRYNTRSLTEKQEAFIRGELKTTAFLVIKDDQLLFEKYWEGSDAGTRSDSFSMAKSVVSALIGVALGEGKLKSVQQTLGELLPIYRNTDKAGIRLIDLLTMSSGLDYYEAYGNPFADSAKSYYTSDLAAQALALRRVDEPGQVFRYQSSNQIYLAQVLDRVTGKTLSAYASASLWKPLHAENPALWSLDRAGGLEKAYCCIAATARDFARFGSLYLHGGRFGDRQLVPSEYVEASVRPAELTKLDGSPYNGYGYSWWLFSHRGQRVFSARGILGQFITVIPEQRLIMVRLGHTTTANGDPENYNDVHFYLDTALGL